MVRAVVLFSVALAAACSVVVDDTLDGKPSEHAITGGVGGLGVGGLGVGAAGGSTAATGGFGGGAGGDATGGGGGSGGGVVCKIHDDFDDGVLDAMWDQFTTTDSGVSLAESNGSMEITIPAGGGNRWGRVRTVNIPTDGCGMTVAYVPSAGVPNGEEVAYAELDQGGLRAGFHLHGPLLKFRKNQTTVSSVTYQAGVHAWWRIRADGDDLVWETSDGLSWVEREREPSHIDVQQAEILLGAGINSGFSTDGLTVRYDDLNVNAPR